MLTGYVPGARAWRHMFVISNSRRTCVTSQVIYIYFRAHVPLRHKPLELAPGTVKHNLCLVNYWGGFDGKPSLTLCMGEKG